MTIDSIVSVSISAATATPARSNFGTPLILCHLTEFADVYREYTGIQGMVADGFSANDMAYKIAADIFAQNPRPEKVVVAKMPAGGQAVFEIDTTGISAGETIDLTYTDLSGVSTDVSEPFDTDAGTTATNLAATLTALSDISASAALNVVTVTATAGPFPVFSDLGGTAPYSFKETTADLGYDTRLDTVLAAGAAFYCVLLDSHSDANVSDVAAWAAGNKKMFGAAPLLSKASDYTTTASALKGGNNDRAWSIAHQGGGAVHPAAAWAGALLPYDPGARTWALKSPVGVVPDPWTTTEITTLETDNTNHATSVAGLTLTRQGITHGGEYIDITRGLDWLENEIQVQILANLANAGKVPYTDEGIAVIRNAVEAALKTAEARGVLVADSSLVTVPKAADALPADKAARILRDVAFTATLAGAVHRVTVVGTATL